MTSIERLEIANNAILKAVNSKDRDQKVRERNAIECKILAEEQREKRRKQKKLGYNIVVYDFDLQILR